MDDTPYINDGADTSLRKTVSLLNKIEAKTGSGSGSSSGTITATPRSGALSKPVIQVSLTPGTPLQVLPENLNRKYLLVQNLSFSEFYMGIGYAPTNPNNYGGIGNAPSVNSGYGLLLPSNGGGIIFEGFYIPTAAIYLLGVAANQAFIVIEG